MERAGSWKLLVEVSEINSYFVSRSFHLFKLTNGLISETQWQRAVRKDIYSVTESSIIRQLEWELKGFKKVLYVTCNIPQYFPPYALSVILGHLVCSCEQVYSCTLYMLVNCWPSLRTGFVTRGNCCFSTVIHCDCSLSLWHWIKSSDGQILAKNPVTSSFKPFQTSQYSICFTVIHTSWIVEEEITQAHA